MQHKQAKEIAIKILKMIEPFCLKSDIVGSCRREKQEVKDIEIICVPRITPIKDLFDTEVGSQRSYPFCKAVKSLGVVLSGKIETGRYIKIALVEGINFDLFIPQTQDYERMKAIRTGSAEYSHKVIAAGWLKVGYCGTEDGLRLIKECYEKIIGTYPDGREKRTWICNNPNPTLPPVWQDEVEFFRFINVPWVEPKFRNV